MDDPATFEELMHENKSNQVKFAGLLNYVRKGLMSKGAKD